MHNNNVKMSKSTTSKFIHVSNATLSATLFFKVFNRDRFLKGLTPKCQVLESRPLKTKQNYQCQNGSKIVEIGQKLAVCRTKYFNPKSWVFLKTRKSINRSPGTIFGRSELGEGSIFASYTFPAHCEFWGRF